MKKLILLVILAFITGCGGSNSNSDTTGSNTPSTVNTNPTTQPEQIAQIVDETASGSMTTSDVDDINIPDQTPQVDVSDPEGIRLVTAYAETLYQIYIERLDTNRWGANGYDYSQSIGAVNVTDYTIRQISHLNTELFNYTRSVATRYHLSVDDLLEVTFELQNLFTAGLVSELESQRMWDFYAPDAAEKIKLEYDRFNANLAIII